MRVNVLRKLARMSVVGALVAGCADPGRSVAPGAAPSLLTDGTEITNTTDGPPSALEPLRTLIETALLKPYYLPATLDDTYRLANGDCAKSSALLAVGLDAYAQLVGEQVAPPAGTTWEALAQAVVADLGAECKLTLPAGALDANAIVRYVKASAGAQLRSPDELVALDIPAGAMGDDALVVVTRDLATTIGGTSLPQWGPAYRVATYPATTLTSGALRTSIEFYFVGSPTVPRPPASVENWLAIAVGAGSGGANSGGTAVITQPEYCAVLSNRIGRWGGASFLKVPTPTVTAPTAADLSLGGFGMAFLSDSAGTTGSGCGQAPPGFASDEATGDAPARAAGTAVFDVQAPGVALAAVDANAYGTFGVVQIYDPTLSAQVRAGLSATVCGRVATLTNTTGRDVVAILDPVNRATGRWSSWKLPVLVPPGGATATLPLTGGDTKAGEVQLSYGPESLAHVGLSSGCPAVP